MFSVIFVTFIFHKTNKMLKGNFSFVFLYFASLGVYILALAPVWEYASAHAIVIYD